MKTITTITLMLVGFLTQAQPACPNNPVPLDDYLPLLFVVGAIVGTAFYYKKSKLINN